MRLNELLRSSNMEIDTKISTKGEGTQWGRVTWDGNYSIFVKDL